MMSATEAMETLRPLLTQRRAVESLVQIFEAAIQTEAAIPEIQKRQAQAEKDCAEALARFAADVVAADLKAQKALSEAQEAQDRAAAAERHALASADATVATVKAAAAQRAEAARVEADAKCAEYIALTVAAQQEAEAEEARLAALKAATAEQDKSLKAIEKRLADLRAKLG